MSERERETERETVDVRAEKSRYLGALHVLRSTCYLLSAIVGHKTPSQVSKNTALAKYAVLTAEQYISVQVQPAGGNPLAIVRNDDG